MDIRPYILVPNLIEQPTWGGKYIAKFKNLPYSDILNLNLGQSYELFANSKLSLKVNTLQSPSVELSHPQNPENTKLVAKSDQPFSINSLISQNPEQILGKKYLKRFGSKIATLIKFTQAKDNSFQIHVRRPDKTWIPKPESWYFFETGLVTLGVKPGINWQEYQQVCEQINQQAILLGTKLKKNLITHSQAKTQLANLIAQAPPEKFVNLIPVKKNQAIDLSSGGIHHSWEEDSKIAPLGNVVYEVQENAYDDVSTIRCFDQGKIQADGTVRPVQIDEYFKYIDRSPSANLPQNHMIKANQQIFSTPSYSMQEITFTHLHPEKLTDSFHHLFVKQGQVQLKTNHANLSLSQGYSVFIPLAIKNYQLLSTQKSVVLKTYL